MNIISAYRTIVRGYIFILLLTFSLSALAREHISFNNNWKFQLGEVPNAMVKEFDDSGWRTLNLPHDWAIEGKFSEDNPSGSSGGALPGGIGWYRKTFSLQPSDAGRCIYIRFDGVYMNSEVFINGHSLGVRPYGYISFQYDLTPYLNYGEPNILAVRVDNSEQPNSRWYSGCGIYRNVWLTKTSPIHVDLWGTYVTTPQVNDKSATISVVTTLKNNTKTNKGIKVISSVLNAKGEKLASQSQEITATASSTGNCTQEILLDNPVLWDLENPYLYTLKTEIYTDGKQTDAYDTPFGIRTFYFDAAQGFILNGQKIKIKGVCQHHDLGCLGAAVNVRAMERQLEILKEMGCNGIRCAHNPPAPELLDLCDRMGFIVMNETFDMWRKRKSAHDYSRYFDEWHERDLTDLILRDRNHPSVFMWSIGNEVLEQWTHADADTLNVEQANLLLNFKRDPNALSGEKDGEMSVNSLLTQKLSRMVRELDPTRPVTAGNNEPNPNNHLFKANTLDIIGFNYHDADFRNVPQHFPGKPFIVTESTSALMTRGYYRMPSDSMYIWPVRWDIPFHDPSYSCSSYDNCHVPWGSTHEQTWKLVKNNDFISGMYLWTGFDYLGEPTPFSFPARSSYFGVVDLAGFPKDAYYMYQSEWSDKNVLHLFPHWNWKEGESIDMWAYYNNADEVELYINGKSQGTRIKEKDVFHVMWRVIFEPGTVKIVARKNNKEIMSKEIHTTGTPAHIRLTADRNHISADGKDLCFVTVEVTDDKGNICPQADHLINFHTEGPAFIAGTDNGCQYSLESFKAPYRKAFNGKCLVVLQNNGKSGVGKLTATSDNLREATLRFETE